MILAISLLSTFAIAIHLGNRLASQGMTAENALQRYQRQIHGIGFGALGLGTLFGVALTTGRNSPWIPSFLFLYTGAYFWQAILLVCGLAAGLVLGLEWSGRKDSKRLRQLVLFSLMSLGAIAFLLYQNQPITNLAGAPRMVDGVVLQTTPYSCAAAAIATLHRQVDATAATTELEIIQLAGTSRHGTSTLAEMRAMESLGLMPEYRRNLAIADLVSRNQLAILHVREPTGRTRIQHAIVLLRIDAEAETLTVANPLSGRHIKRFDDMEGYWLREAVFVTMPDAANRLTR